MEFNRETKNMIAIIAFVAAITFGINYVVVAEPDRSFISWSVGLFVVAVLFWIWIRRDDIAEKRSNALQQADEAAKQAEDLAEKAKAKAETHLESATEKVEIVAEEIHDYTEEIKEAVEEATSGEPDDLSKVEGIGPVYQTILKEAGVGTFSAIASKTQTELEQIIKDAGKRRPASIETWAEQAALAAKGDWDGLAKLQSKLDGGRRK